MKYIIENIASYIAPYSVIILILIYVCIAVISIIIIKTIIEKAKHIAENRQLVNKQNLKNINMRKIVSSQRGEVLRTAISADGIDPAELSYMRIMDGGKELWVSTYTLKTKPTNTKFGKTFTPLFNFRGCLSSVFLVPKTAEEVQHKFERQTVTLESEYMRSSGDPNRRRKLSYQINEVNEWAAELEQGENKFFEVGFLFTIFGESLQDLKKAREEFFHEAKARGIIVTNCYGLQAEAYALNNIFNGHVYTNSRVVKHTPINFVTMDKYSVSTLLNFLQVSFSHKTGIPIGRDIFTKNLVVFDLFEPLTHDSYSLAIAGMSGSGKSLTTKVMMARSVVLNTHYVCIDSQQKKGCSEGEYATAAILAGGMNFQLRHNAKECLNLFDIDISIVNEKINEDTVREIRKLDIAGKITTLVNNLCSIILSSASGKFDKIAEQTYVQSILSESIKELYDDFGIIEDDPDSLYEDAKQVTMGITSGKVRKSLPTLSDFYVKLLTKDRDNNEEHLVSAFRHIIYGLRDYVKEVYYSKDSVKIFTASQYAQLPANEFGKKIYINTHKQIEEVVAIKGNKTYYDGQSTIAVNRDCPFVNLDISMMPDADKKLARQICMSWITENFIKKNSERIDANNKLVVVLDEVHECYKDEYARSTVDITVREARKRYVGIILITQTLSEYENYPETQAILKLVECKFVFKQPYKDRDYLIESLGITDSQADMIVNTIGGDPDSDADKNTHKGEMALIDGKHVAFVHVDYLKDTEEILADTDASSIAQRIKIIA